MDKKFIEQNNLNEAVKRFNEIADYKSPKQSLNEFTFVTQAQMTEDGEDGGENGGELQQPNDNMQQQPMGDMQQPQNASPNAQNQGDDMNGQMGGEMPPGGTEMPQNGQMGAQGDMQQQPMGDMPMDNAAQGEEMGDLGVPQVDDRLSKIFAVVKDFSDKLDKQEQSIMNLKNEFEKRNPTQTEKFNLRSQAGGPYNQTPTSYWDKLTRENPNYEVIRDNDVSPSDEQDKFKIKKNDISGLNMKNISDTLDINQNLSDYLGF